VLILHVFYNFNAMSFLNLPKSFFLSIYILIKCYLRILNNKKISFCFNIFLFFFNLLL